MEQNFLDVTPSNLDTKAVLECIRGFREMCNGQGVEHAAELNEKVEAVARENAKLLVDIEKGHATNKQLQNELHLLQAADRKAQSIIENMQNCELLVVPVPAAVVNVIALYPNQNIFF